MHSRFARSRTLLGKHTLVLAILAAVQFAAATARAQIETVIYNFPYDSYPVSRPMEDNSGAFFVTAPDRSNEGTAMKVSENRGNWIGRKIFRFRIYDGEYPVAGVIADPDDVLYGLTQGGGANNFGTIFSLKKVRGKWVETVLHDFTGGADGGAPIENLVLDKATGTLYGTTPIGGGRSGCGTIFSVVPVEGNWTFNTLYSFAGRRDGCAPNAPVHGGVKKGTFFGTTRLGGASNSGTVYELSEKNGAWSESVIYSFTGANDGSTPSDLDIDTDTGNMFGVTDSGGTLGYGVAFELSKSGQEWTQSVLYNFTGMSDGGTPVGLHFEKAGGVLLGTTKVGGTYGDGTLFKLTKSGANWSETVLHSFGGSRFDGQIPQSRPVEDPDTGVIYGTTMYGGQYGGGTVYAVVP